MKYYWLMLNILLLQACTVGPDFVRPDPPVSEQYTTEKDLKEFGSQKIQPDKKLSETWWHEFSSPQLNEVVELGLRNNNTLASVKKNIEQAEDSLKATQGQLWPFITMDAGAGRQKYGASFLGPLDFILPPFTYYQVGPSLTYLVDLFGLTRRAIENQEALAEYAMHVYDAAYLAYTGRIVNNALNIAVINAQLEAANAMVRQDEKNQTMMETSFKMGGATQNDVLAAQNQLSTDKILLPKLRLQLQQAKNEMNNLVGLAPTEWQCPEFQLKNFKLPKDLPLSLPSELARTRPDILASEAVLHAASANIGVATANMYPKIVLTGSYLQEALTPGGLFQASSAAWSYFGNISAPLFNGGALSAQKRAAIRIYESSFYSYQDVVLKSLVQVNDVLHALQFNEEANQQGKQSLAIAKRAYDLAKKSEEAGAVGTLAVLQAERRYREAQIAYARIEGQRYQDTVQLYLVLGGRDFTDVNNP